MRTFLSALLLAGILAAGAALAAVLYAKEERRVHDDERDRADRAAFVLEQTVATTALSLRGVAGLFDASESVSRMEFGRYARPLFARQPALSGVGWMPRVTRAGRPAYERRTGHRIVEGPPQERHIAAARAVHFPTAYAVTTAASFVPGFDAASDSSRRATIERAARSGRPQATSVVRLARTGQRGLIVYQPVFTARGHRLRGVVSGGYRLSELMKVIRGGLPAGTAVQVRQGGGVIAGPARMNRGTDVRLTAAGNAWTLRVASDRTPSRTPALLALGAGLLLFAMALLLLRQAAGRERYAQAVAARMAAEQVALRHVATHIASAGELDALFALVVRELAGLAGAREVAVVRDADEGPELVATSLGTLAVGVPPAGPGVTQAAVRTAGGRWGAVVVRDPRPEAAEGLEQQVRHFADLVGVGVANDEVRRELSLRAATDGLTGLANRRTFDERLEAEVSRAARHGRPLALAVFDIDHFKRTNDRLGHVAGDAVLESIAATLAGAARRGDVVARLGGEEFGWLMPECDLEAAVAAAGRVRLAVRDAEHPGGLRQTISAGVHAMGPGTGDAQALYAAADAALYAAKRGGRDRVEAAASRATAEPARHAQPV